MKRWMVMTALLLPLVGVSGCKKKGYLFTMKVLRENTQPANNFSIDAWVKGKSQAETKKTGSDGIAVFDDLPYPDSTHPLNASVHYFHGKRDDTRNISYPFIPSDATRLKDTQYIPNTVTPSGA